MVFFFKENIINYFQKIRFFYRTTLLKSWISWNIRNFLILGLKSLISQNIRKMFSLENIWNFPRGLFRFFELGIKSASGGPINCYCLWRNFQPLHNLKCSTAFAHPLFLHFLFPFGTSLDVVWLSVVIEEQVNLVEQVCIFLELLKSDHV